MVEQQHPQPLELPSALIGSEEINVRILKGGLAIDETIRNLIRTRLKTHLNDEEYLLRLFVGGKWRFQDNGQFFFIPAPNANVGSELFPIPGISVQIDDQLEFQAQRQSATSGVVSLDGSLHRISDRWRVEFLYAIASYDLKIVQISQVLTLTTGSESSEIQGLPVPSTFCIQLTGQVDEQTFEDLTGTLKLQPHFHQQDTNPCVVRLATDNQDGIGRFLWGSFAGTATDEGKRFGTVRLHDSQAQIEFLPNQLIQAGLTWETQNTGELAELLPTQGVDVQTGTLNFAINSGRISGSIQASGRVFNMMSDETAQVSTYEAQFLGHRQTEDWSSWLEALFTHQSLDSSIDDTSTDTIPVPSVFEIGLCGETNGQDFAELPGTLTILSRMNSVDPNPFSVTLSANNSDVEQHGCLQWQTFSDVGDRQVLESRVFVEAGQVRLEVEPSNTFRTLVWKIQAPAGQVQFVQIEQGTMTFAVQDNKLCGEINATGFTLDDRRAVCTYHAQVTGRKRGSPLADELRTLFNSSSLQGTWETGDRDFSTVDLQVVNHQIRGTYTARNGGVITGMVDTSRLNFIWRDQQIEGTGWARALGNRGLLIGGWCESAAMKQPQFFVGTRKYSMMLESINLTSQDAEELRAIGQELWQQRRGELAIPLLEKVLKFYETQRLENPEQDFSNALITEGNVLDLLIRCEMQAHQFDLSPALLPFWWKWYLVIQSNLPMNPEKLDLWFISLAYHLIARRSLLPKYLQDALRIQQRLNPYMDWKQHFERKVDQLSNYLSQTLNQIQEMSKFIQAKPLILEPKAEINTAYSDLSAQIQELQLRLRSNCQELAAFKSNMNASQQELDLTWIPLISYLSNQRTDLHTEIDRILQRQKIVFSQELELLNDLELLLQGLDFQAIHGASLEALQALDEIETRLKARLSSHSTLTDLEKGLFQKQYGVILALVSLTNLLEVIRLSLVKLEEANFLSQGTQIVQQSMIGLSEHMESWRGSLVRESDKIEALAQGQSFFRALIPLLIEFKAFPEALITVEKAKTRAFADLLVTPAKMQSSIRQIFSTEKMLLSIANAPPMTFQAVVELLKA